MASTSPVAHRNSWPDTALPSGLETPPLGYILTAVLVVVACVALRLTKKDDIPFINPPKWFRLRSLARMDFLETGMQVFDKAKSTVPDKPFKVLYESGDVTVLPPRFAHSIRNEKDLSFAEAVKKVCVPDSRPPILSSQCRSWPSQVD
jgi:hypothetical protein